MAVHLNNDDLTMHQPHPGSEMAKAAVVDLRKFLDQLDIRPQPRRK